ncbi:MAG: efflux RND transporter periplasmic adaptor subunit [Calditerrivibrio sp.]|nr:efflux RND transporter periplasmic adaptor subunit [Calditerrivibrio sp.]MCA1932598.1 efflux RND transporter periplasmic adaptor subunit [Calditerrivibrio sp.]MCA1980315.1 efflux RND transporter periplasmic adaptor subunit [Calditerrivibrio sp.]
MKKVLIFIVVIVLIGSGIFFYISKNKKQTVQIINTDIVKIGDVSGFLQQTGIIKAQVGAQISVGARATGTITMLKVKVGDKVKKGELVAMIDDRETQAQINEIKTALASIENEIEQENAIFPSRKALIEKELESNHSKLILAKNKYEREKELLKKGFSTVEQLESVKTEYEVAQNNLKSSEISLAKLEKEHQLTLTNLRLKKEREISNLSALNVRLSYTRIISPIDGIVSQVNADEGETIVAGLQVANLITVFNPDMLEMWIYIDETDIGKVKIGDYVEYTVDTYGDKKFNGTLKKIYYEPVVKDSIVYYLGIVGIEKKDAELLKPEMTTHVKIRTSERKGVLSVKNGAIKFESGEQVVYRVTDKKNNMVERQVVKVGVKGEERSEIITGLNENDEVAVKIILPPDFSKRKDVSQKNIKKAQ